MPDAALLAVDGVDAPLVKLFLGTVTAYASAPGIRPEIRRNAARPRRTRDRGDSVARDAGRSRIRQISHRDFGSESLERLYALGLDAFRIAQALMDGPPVQFAPRRRHRPCHAGRRAATQCARGAWRCTARDNWCRSMARGESTRPPTARADAGARAEEMAAEFLVARGLAIVASQFCSNAARRDRPDRA